MKQVNQDFRSIDLKGPTHPSLTTPFFLYCLLSPYAIILLTIVWLCGCAKGHPSPLEGGKYPPIYFAS